jgi:hypothetical protein
MRVSLKQSITIDVQEETVYMLRPLAGAGGGGVTGHR